MYIIETIYPDYFLQETEKVFDLEHAIIRANNLAEFYELYGSEELAVIVIKENSHVCYKVRVNRSYNDLLAES